MELTQGISNLGNLNPIPNINKKNNDDVGIKKIMHRIAQRIFKKNQESSAQESSALVQSSSSNKKSSMKTEDQINNSNLFSSFIKKIKNIYMRIFNKEKYLKIEEKNKFEEGIKNKINELSIELIWKKKTFKNSIITQDEKEIIKIEKNELEEFLKKIDKNVFGSLHTTIGMLIAKCQTVLLT